MKNIIKFILIGLAFAAFPGEILVQILARQSFVLFLASMTSYVILLLFGYYIYRRFIQNNYRLSRILIYAVFFGILGLMIEWFILGNAPWQNAETSQSGMFSFWVGVFLLPVMFMDENPKTKKLIAIFLKIYIPIVAVILGLLTFGKLMSNYGVWLIGLKALIILFHLLFIFYGWYFLMIYKRKILPSRINKKLLKIITLFIVIVSVGFVLFNFKNENSDSVIKIIKDESRIASLPETAEILFVSNRDTGNRRNEIYSMDANGENQERLTFTSEHHFIVAIDHSKRYIIDSRADKDTDKPWGLGDEDRRAIWIIDLKDKTETRLTDPKNKAESRSFSPDGEWIVFCMTVKGEEQNDIYKIKRDGTGLQNLTNTKTVTECDPSWSNDGKKIAFDSLDGLVKNPRLVLKAMDTNGNNIQTIYDGGEGVQIGNVWPPGNYDPAWSPDDQWIIFERAVKYNSDNPENFGSGIWHIFKAKTDGSEEVIDLSLSGGHSDRAQYLPSFSLDGNKIVFSSIYENKADQKQSHNDIFLMDINSNLIKQLTQNSATDQFAVWIK